MDSTWNCAASAVKAGSGPDLPCCGSRTGSFSPRPASTLRNPRYPTVEAKGRAYVDAQILVPVEVSESTTTLVREIVASTAPNTPLLETPKLRVVETYRHHMSLRSGSKSRGAGYPHLSRGHERWTKILPRR